MRPRRLKISTHLDSGQMYHVYQNQAAAAYSTLYSFFFLSNFQHWNFSSLFSQELWGLEDWNLIDSGQMYHVYWNRAAAAHSSHYFFIFLSLQFSTLKYFVTLFSGTVRPRRLKLGTHVDSGQMYHVHRNQAAAAYSSLYFFIFLSLQFSTLKFFVTLFSGTMRPRRLKISTHVDSGQIYHMYQNQAAAAYSFLHFSFSPIFMYTGIRLLLLIHPIISSFFFLSNFQTLKFFITLFSGTNRLKDWNLVQMWIVGWCIVYTGIRLLLFIRRIISSFSLLSNYQTLKIFITFFSGTVRSRRLKLGTHMDSGQMYRVYRNQAAAYLSLYFFICLSLQFSNIKIFRHTVLMNCEV